MNRHSILRVVAKFMIPYILLFAFYVQFHGELGPGGGFQAGVIFASAFILYALIFGIENGRKVLPASVNRIFMGGGVLLFALVGLEGMILGSEFLDYNVLGPNPLVGQHLGIFLIELGVGMTVASTMIAIFYVFAGQDV